MQRGVEIAAGASIILSIGYIWAFNEENIKDLCGNGNLDDSFLYNMGKTLIWDQNLTDLVFKTNYLQLSGRVLVSYLGWQALRKAPSLGLSLIKGDYKKEDFYPYTPPSQLDVNNGIGYLYNKSVGRVYNSLKSKLV